MHLTKSSRINDKNSLKQELEDWYKKICVKDFIAADPVQFLHRYTKHKDIEIAAFLTATIAWGRRDLILRSAEKMFNLMGNKPYTYVMNDDYNNLKKKNIHRTFFESDLKYFCRGLKHCYTKYGNLEKLFTSTQSAGSQLGIWKGITLFREEMARANKGYYSKHISNPGKEGFNGSACKRLNLALRWLVRGAPVDLGLWKSINPSALYIPLDVHVARTARKLGLLQRKSNDKKAVIELTENLRKLNPEDPVRYDFSLFGMGVGNL
jgi:uncharacterized protein (TIGR02757 family)